MAIEGILETFDLETEAPEVARDKFSHLEKAARGFVKAFPGGSSQTDILRASGLYFLCPREFVLNYWNPKPRSGADWAGTLRMSMGEHLHHWIQNCVLGPMGVLRGTWVRQTPLPAKPATEEGYHPDPERAIDEIANRRSLTWVYSERTVWDEQHRISGHLDGIVNVARLNYLFDEWKALKGNPLALAKSLATVTEDEEATFEFKTTGEHVFKKTHTARDVADYYKMQASIYQNLTGIPRTLFWYMHRDHMGGKLLQYDYESSWWNTAKFKARQVWESIRDEKLPDMMACKLPTDKRAKTCPHSEPCWHKLDFAEYVKAGKERAKREGRKLLDLSGMKFDE